VSVECKKIVTFYPSSSAAESDDLGNIALCLEGTGEVDESLATFDRTLQIAHEASLSKEEADWHKGKGSTLVGLGRYDAALGEYGRAQQVYESSGLKRELIESLNDIGRIYELLGDATAAERQFQRALESPHGGALQVISRKPVFTYLYREAWGTFVAQFRLGQGLACSRQARCECNREWPLKTPYQSTRRGDSMEKVQRVTQR